MATDRNGNSILAWSRYVTAQKSVVYGRRVTLGSKLDTPVVMGSGFAPAVTTDPVGSGMIAWQTIPLPQPGGTGGVVGQIYERPVTTTTGTFGTTHRVTADGATFELAENAAGQHAMIWQQSAPQYPAVVSFDPRGGGRGRALPLMLKRGDYLDGVAAFQPRLASEMITAPATARPTVESGHRALL